MALNLIKELSKQGYTRKKNKSFLLNKVTNYNTEDLIKKNSILFKDPNTFLKLPHETNFDYIINKIPRGPQYDLGDKLIPYTMVGNSKYIKMHKFQNSLGSKSFNRKIFKSKSKLSTLSKVQDFKGGYNLITDREIEDIFDNYKNKIKENKNKCKDLIDKNECPKVMKQYIDMNLSLQEKCLKKNEDNLNSLKNMKGRINQKMNIHSKLNIKKSNNKNYLENNSSNKDIQLSIGELLGNSGEEFRFKNKIKTIVDKNNSEFILPEVNEKWEDSLRNPRQIIKQKKRMINFKLQKYPYWLIPSEKEVDNVSKNKIKNNTNYNNDYSSRTSSMYNLFIPESKKSQISDEKVKNSIRKNYTSDGLEIKGKKLIDVEEKINKNLKGRKKILKFKNFHEEVKDMMIYSNYIYNNYYTAK